MAMVSYKLGRLNSFDASEANDDEPVMFFKRNGFDARGGAGVKKKSLLRKWRLVLISAAALIFVVLGFRFYNLYRFHLEKQTRFMMDTYVTIYAVGPKGVSAHAINSALDRMQEVDTKFNSQNPASPVYAFNHQGVPISDPEIIDMVRLALQISRDSDGSFDITVEPLIELWGFYGESPRLPSEKAVKDCLSKIGYYNLTLKNAMLQKRKPDIKIDLGGIAKGYAVSQAVKVLKREGVTSALIDAGGDVYALGKKGREPWKIGIRSPRGDAILGYVEIEDMAVMGSGDYERFFIKDGKRYHHIFDPKTGYPAEGLTATTCIHPDPMVADAWNTAIFVLGPEKGLKRVETIAAMETIMVTTSGDIIYSAGLKNTLHRLKPE